MSIDVPELANLEQVRGRWRGAVAGVLAKSTRKDPEELGEQPERLLETPTYDGIAIRALYTALFHILVQQGYYKAYAGVTLPNPASVGLHSAMGIWLQRRSYGHKRQVAARASRTSHTFRLCSERWTAIRRL